MEKAVAHGLQDNSTDFTWWRDETSKNREARADWPGEGVVLGLGEPDALPGTGLTTEQMPSGGNWVLLVFTSSPSRPLLLLVCPVPGAAIRGQERGRLRRLRGDVSASRRDEFRAGGKVECGLGLEAGQSLCWFLPMGPRMAPQIQSCTAVLFDCTNLLLTSHPAGAFGSVEIKQERRVKIPLGEFSGKAWRYSGTTKVKFQ